jgi:hypothetical protein
MRVYQWYHQSKSVDHLPEIHTFHSVRLLPKINQQCCLSSSKELTGSFHVIDVKLTRFNGIKQQQNIIII